MRVRCSSTSCGETFRIEIVILFPLLVVLLGVILFSGRESIFTNMAYHMFRSVTLGRVCAHHLTAGPYFRAPSNIVLSLSKTLPAIPTNLHSSSSLIRFTSTGTPGTASEHGHSHVRIWTAERILSASLLGLIPTAFITNAPVLDYALALALTTHVHWGLEAILVDYVRASIFGETVPKVAVSALYAISMLTLGGLFYFNYNDVGLVQAIKLLWKL